MVFLPLIPHSLNRIFYFTLYCSLTVSKRGKARFVIRLQGEELFYLNWAAVQRYGLYKPSIHPNFYRDMKVLCDIGFIEKVASGAGQMRKSIYRFSDRWQSWEPGSG